MKFNENKLARKMETFRLKVENLIPAQLPKKMDVPSTTINCIPSKYDKSNQVSKSPGSGRKRSLDDKDIGIITRETVRNSIYFK